MGNSCAQECCASQDKANEVTLALELDSEYVFTDSPIQQRSETYFPLLLHGKGCLNQEPLKKVNIVEIPEIMTCPVGSPHHDTVANMLSFSMQDTAHRVGFHGASDVEKEETEATRKIKGRKATGFVTKEHLGEGTEDATRRVTPQVGFRVPADVHKEETEASRKIKDRKGTGFVTKEHLLQLMDDAAEDMAQDAAPRVGFYAASDVQKEETAATRKIKGRKGTGFVTKQRLHEMTHDETQDVTPQVGFHASCDVPKEETEATRKIKGRKGTGFVTKEHLLKLLDEATEEQNAAVRIDSSDVHAEETEGTRRIKGRKGTNFVRKEHLLTALTMELEEMTEDVGFASSTGSTSDRASGRKGTSFVTKGQLQKFVDMLGDEEDEEAEEEAFLEDTPSVALVFVVDGKDRQVVLHRRPLGVGFSKAMMGGATKICKVEPQSYASELGIQPGWAIKSIGSENVSKKSTRDIKDALQKALTVLPRKDGQ